MRSLRSIFGLKITVGSKDESEVFEKMFEYAMLENIEESLEKIRLIYKNASEERKKFIEDWISGITIDKEDGDGYLNVEFDGENISIIDDETDKEIKLEDLKEYELWALASELKDLLDELGGG